VARGDDLARLAADFGLARVTIEDLVAYRRAAIRSRAASLTPS
jgi:3,4-dihydroxy-2-butanone 4-phosphate synthase